MPAFAGMTSGLSCPRRRASSALAAYRTLACHPL